MNCACQDPIAHFCSRTHLINMEGVRCQRSATLRAGRWRAVGYVAPQLKTHEGYSPAAPCQRPASTQRTHSLFMRWVLSLTPQPLSGTDLHQEQRPDSIDGEHDIRMAF